MISLLFASVICSANPFDLPINQGNWTVSGNLATTYTDTTGSIFSGTPGFEYFFWSRFSAGLVSSFNWDNYSSYVGYGPTISYHFWQGNRWTALANASTQRNSWSDISQVLWTYQARIGALYFLARPIAFGPMLSYSATANPRPIDSSYVSLSARFWVFF